VTTKKPVYKIENLVVLQYASNICYTELVKLELDKLPDGVLSVDLNEGTWEADIPNFCYSTKRTLRFGDEKRKCPDSCRFGTIGIYDKSNIVHLNTMLHDAQDATEETLVHYD